MSKRYERRPLLRSEWRYYLIAFSDHGNELFTFLRAANLSRPALQTIYHVYTEEPFGKGRVMGWGGDPVAGVVAYEIPHLRPLEVLDENAMQRLRAAYRALTRLDPTKHLAIASATQAFEALKRIPSGNSLRVLGLFSVLEMLLTHNPNDRELGDSLAHQISTKVPLLMQRFSEPFDRENFGKGAPDSTVWKKLYEYRSAIAHGGQADFMGRLQLLDSPTVVLEYLDETVRRLVRHALDEPDLVDALKPV
jgi:hypothetical protein